MDSVKTKSNNYKLLGYKAIGGIVLIPEAKGFRIYVAWEWPAMAKRGFFGICKSSGIHSEVTNEIIESVANYGNDISETPEAKKVFSHLF